MTNFFSFPIYCLIDYHLSIVPGPGRWAAPAPDPGYFAGCPGQYDPATKLSNDQRWAIKYNKTLTRYISDVRKEKSVCVGVLCQLPGGEPSRSFMVAEATGHTCQLLKLMEYPSRNQGEYIFGICTPLQFDASLNVLAALRDTAKSHKDIVNISVMTLDFSSHTPLSETSLTDGESKPTGSSSTGPTGTENLPRTIENLVFEATSKSTKLLLSMKHRKDYTKQHASNSVDTVGDGDGDGRGDGDDDDGGDDESDRDSLVAAIERELLGLDEHDASTEHDQPSDSSQTEAGLLEESEMKDLEEMQESNDRLIGVAVQLQSDKSFCDTNTMDNLNDSFVNGVRPYEDEQGEALLEHFAAPTSASSHSASQITGGRARPGDVQVERPLAPANLSNGVVERGLRKSVSGLNSFAYRVKFVMKSCMRVIGLTIAMWLGQ